jgi:hypothetical protein
MSKLIFLLLFVPLVTQAQITLSDLGIDSKNEVPEFQLSKHDVEERHLTL